MSQIKPEEFRMAADALNVEANRLDSIALQPRQNANVLTVEARRRRELARKFIDVAQDQPRNRRCRAA